MLDIRSNWAVTIDDCLSLFATICHCSPLFALFETIRTIRDYSLLAIRDYSLFAVRFFQTPLFDPTKWPWHTQTFLDHRLLFIHVYKCRELSKRVLLQTFQEDSSWLNRLRGKQWSVIQRTSKICDRHAWHRWGKYNVPCTQTYVWKEKVAVLMLPRFQWSLQRTKTLILKPGKRF